MMTLSKRIFNSLFFLLLFVILGWLVQKEFVTVDDKGVLSIHVTPAVPSVTVDPTTVLKAPSEGVKAQVTRVVDGDTIQVLLDGQKKTVRLIGIDSPETVDPRRSVQCFGKEASNKAKEVLDSRMVFLVADRSQNDVDKYDRLLRYVWLEDGTNFNLLMIKEGYAFEYTYEFPYLYQKEFKQAQKEAQMAKKGLWSNTTCNGEKKSVGSS